MKYIVHIRANDRLTQEEKARIMVEAKGKFDANYYIVIVTDNGIEITVQPKWLYAISKFFNDVKLWLKG